MQRITLSDEDAEHIRDWQRLSSDEKEAINKLAKALGDEAKRKSLYDLLAAQSEIANMIAIKAHLSWFMGMLFKAGTLATVALALAGVYKLFFGGKT
ncbi:hypothetical protein ACP46_gp43 [Rhizobium phage RHEph06]|uniref:Transmembrane protein n=4 Tax=Kleczkowskavirus RHEph4 TaxID=1921526 RepID=A0A7S5QWZ0_9CAUD|nr:hypothetical protein ACP46_gp43 [Rhizobium phage RHEph06]YP_009598484.1 hypothetical protein FDH25_gp42 [Rhizobium phage RHEph04]AGC35804.1 hypothetical protein RHEph05_gp037 [Rhizobium phage RHEph05]QIG67667.1 hypothetical protein EVB51_050 [Rhizobium phage RHph_Y17]QIG68904.1 hypothetical protein EVB71_052 [Rhizobium phage RHph_Y55]QIG68986.1 hypothetical protein EVB73_050 [Rhizobium phage RHph_Y3_43]QIG69535.1 hypothetical protein EVB80_052 [Rhizobium phage RHph_I36]QIG75409.1 hypothet